MESSEEHVELLILTKPTADGERFIKIVEYPCKFWSNSYLILLSAAKHSKSCIASAYPASR